MFSPLKVVLFAFISFAALALAIPSPASPSKDPRDVILGYNNALNIAVDPLRYVTTVNATSDSITPVLDEVCGILAELINDLSLSSLSFCDCTVHDIIALIAITLEIIFEALGICYNSFSGLGPLLGNLVTLIVKLLDVVLALVGGLVTELLVLLIGNGCALVILDLKLTDLINLLGLGGLLPWP